MYQQRDTAEHFIAHHMGGIHNELHQWSQFATVLKLAYYDLRHQIAKEQRLADVVAAAEK